MPIEELEKLADLFSRNRKMLKQEIVQFEVIYMKSVVFRCEKEEYGFPSTR